MGKKVVNYVEMASKEARGFRPWDRASLVSWLKLFVGMEMPERGVCEGHGTPLDYLCHSFFEEKGDAVVWACRGGGKTMVGAVATLLDLLFKPGIQVRILGGSLEQSEKMYGYLLGLVQGRFPEMLKGSPTQRRLELVNGSRVEVLAQSDRSVRGQRVQKLRCDEVELFDEGVWQAAQLTTRSGKTQNAKHKTQNGEGIVVRGSVEAFSTMHKPDGLMRRILKEEEKGEGRKRFSWCVWDVMERCPEERKCEGCALWEGCQGRAKNGNGFVPIEDVIAMKSRVSQATWEHEMLCHPPRVEHGVFPAFRREMHVRSAEGQVFGPGARIIHEGRLFVVEGIYGGVDFGYRGPFVCLWMAMLREGSKPDSPRAVWVLDEMLVREQTLVRNVMAMRDRKWDVVRVYCDVAGKGVNSQTGRSDERVLRDEGFLTRCREMKIDEGIGVINDLLNPAVGFPRLLIDPRCQHLIAAMESYERGKDGQPIKDGVHDHPIDALRYALVNHDGVGSKTEWRLY
ncbi:MAG TPA: hypothetical protein VM008_09690 [Phycisphaerae bacterium]|nr:hypothetical protein [Phycisphaerae bacterium]